MHTEHNGRKTPHAKTANLFGGVSVDTKWVWDFEDDNINSRCIKKHIAKSNVYVEPNRQDLPDDKFKEEDMRNYSTRVWNQKASNLKKFGYFKTNYEIQRMQEDNATLLNFI